MTVVEKTFQVPSNPSMLREAVPIKIKGWTGSSAPLVPGEALKPGEARFSPNASHVLVLQVDGNLVLYRVHDDKALWDSRTNGKSIARAVLQADGNFVVYDAGNAAPWSSDTYGKQVTALLVGDDGQFKLLGAGGPVWSSSAATTWAGPTRLRAGGVLAPDTRLEPGDAVLATDNLHALWYRADGDLAVVQLGTGAVVSHAATAGNGHAAFQADGNLVVYVPDGAGKDRPLWSSGTHGQGATALTLGAAGLLQIVKYGAVLWSAALPAAAPRSLKNAGTTASVRLPEMVVSYARGLTIQARILDGQGTILELGNGPGRDAITLTATAKEIRLSWNTTAEGATKSASIPHAPTPGQWCAIAVVLEAKAVRFYRNGVMTLVPVPDLLLPNETARSRNSIGAGESFAPAAFTGAIADVRLWNRSLPADRITAGSMLLGHESGLSGWWTLGGPEGVRDGSPFGRDGALIDAHTAGATSFTLAAADDSRAFDVTGGKVDVDEFMLGDGNGFAWQAHVRPQDFAADATLLRVWNFNIVVLTVRCEQTTGALVYEILRDGVTRTAKFPGVLKAGQWTALCVRQDVDGAMALFADGIKVGEATGIVMPGVAYKASFGGGFHGQLAEVRLWSRMLTSAEIVDTGARRIHGWAPGLVGCWRMDDVALTDGVLFNSDPTGPKAINSGAAGPTARVGLTFGPPPHVAPPRVAALDGAVQLPVVNLTGAGLSLQLWIHRDTASEGALLSLRSKASQASKLEVRLSKVGDLVLAGGSGSVSMSSQLHGSAVPSVVLRQIDGLVLARRWTQLTLTIDGDGLCCVYRDGRLVAREEGLRILPAAYDACQLGGSTFKGMVTELRVWSRALSESEVGDNWRRRSSAGAGLAARWALAGDLGGSTGPLLGTPTWREAPSLPVRDGSAPTVASVTSRISQITNPTPPPPAPQPALKPGNVKEVKKQIAAAIAPPVPLMCLDLTARDAAGNPLADTAMKIVLCYPAQPSAKPEEQVAKIDLYRDTLADKLTLSAGDRPGVTVVTGARGSVRIVFPSTSLLLPIFMISHARMGEGEWTLVTPDQLLHQTLATLTPNELLKGRRATAQTKAGAAGLVSSGADELAGLLAGMLGAAANFSFEEESTAALAFADDDDAPPPPVLAPVAVGPRSGATFLVPQGAPLTRRLGSPTTALADIAAPLADGDLVMPENFGFYDSVVSTVKSGFTIVTTYVEHTASQALDTVESIGRGIVAAGQSVLKSIAIAADTVINGFKVVANWVVSKVEDMVGAFISLAKAIGKSIGQILDFITALFDWGDIVETADQMFRAVKSSIAASRTGSKQLFDLVEQKVRDLESSLLTLLGGSGVVPAVADESAPVDADDPAPEPPGLLDLLLSLLPDEIEETLRALLSAFDPIGKVLGSVLERLPQLAAGLGAEFEDPALQASLKDPSKFFDSNLDDWKTLARILVKVVANATTLAIDLIGDLFDAVLESLENLLDLRLNIPVLTPFVETTVFGGRSLTVGLMVCLVVAIPTTVTYKLVTGEKTGPFSGAMAFSDDQDDGKGKELAKRGFGFAVTIYSGILDGYGTVHETFKYKFWFTLTKFLLNGVKAGFDGASLWGAWDEWPYASDWKVASDVFNMASWLLGAAGLGCDAISLYHDARGKEAKGVERTSGYLGALSGAAGLVANILGIVDTAADGTTTKGQVALSVADTAASAFDLVAGVTGALPEVDEPEVKAARALVIYWMTGASSVSQAAGFLIYLTTDQNNRDAVTLYADPKYGGANKGFGPGAHGKVDLQTIGNGKLSSIKVVKGFRATVYDHDGWTGRSLDIDADSDNLGALNDQVASVKIRRI